MFFLFVCLIIVPFRVANLWLPSGSGQIDPSLLNSSTLSSKYGHFWLQSDKTGVHKPAGDVTAALLSVDLHNSWRRNRKHRYVNQSLQDVWIATINANLGDPREFCRTLQFRPQIWLFKTGKMWFYCRAAFSVLMHAQHCFCNFHSPQFHHKNRTKTLFNMRHNVLEKLLWHQEFKAQQS